jgi:type 2 lantibiotic biosynthesis protein LanM
MDQTLYQSADWYRALTFAERIASMRSARQSGPPAEIDAELADWRLQRWRSQTPFNADTFFARRLETDGVTEEEFRLLLGEPADAVRRRTPEAPCWLADIAQAYSTSTSLLLESKPGMEWTGFLYAVEPLIIQGRRRLHEELHQIARTRGDLPFDPETIEGLIFAGLPSKLVIMLMRAVTLEVNVARLQGLLDGDTPEERSRNFFQRLRQRETALAFLQEYPVLARTVTAEVDRWVRFSLEFLRHLCTDWDDIKETFTPQQDPGVVTQISVGAGDTHRGGRSVVIARFTSGFQVVYKPRSLSVDIHFQELLTWINERGSHPPFRTLSIVNRGTHGWTEFVSAQACASAEEVRRFYERQGGYLALLYALEATDFHYENLIASGEHPVLIDVESLFHPRTGAPDATGAPEIPGLDALFYSVLRIGLLPQRILANADYEGIDVSGLGMTGGQLSPKSIPYVEGINTDEMRLERKRVEMPTASNRPTLDGKDVQVLNYADALAEGFTSIYRLIFENRDDLLSEDGPLSSFAKDEVRVIARPTRVYSLLLHESFHPDMLGDAIDRDRFFDRLWVAVNTRPYLGRLIQAEREDLYNGDIPFFSTRPSSVDVFTSTGKPIADFFDKTGLELVENRVRQLSEKDLDRQLWFIRASLTSLSAESETARLPRSPIVEPVPTVTREQLLAAACAVGDRLDKLAFRNDHGASWLGLAKLNNRNWTLLPLAIDLYDGLPGISLFLAYLGKVTAKDQYTELAQSALATFRNLKELSTPGLSAIGAFSGWGGIIYTLAHLGVLWDNKELLAEAEEAVELLPALIEKDEQLDLIGGSAGCIASLLSLYKYSPDDRLLAAATLCGQRLISTSKDMQPGRGWFTQIPVKNPLSGFSHGAAGMAWSLLELAAATKEESFRTAALDAIAYERTLFDTEEGNWRDQRDFEKLGIAAGREDYYPVAWCHGSPGIGLARLLTLHILDDPAVRAEIDAAKKSALAKGFGQSHSICHGDLGNLEFLFQVSERLGDRELRSRVDLIASKIVASISREGWLCGTPMGVESPGLMTGLSGIGYSLLRLAEPDRVPAVLALAPPVLHP